MKGGKPDWILEHFIFTSQHTVVALPQEGVKSLTVMTIAA